MRINRNKAIIKIQRRFYEEDIEYLDWLCKINRIGNADMMNAILAAWPQAQIKMESKHPCGAHSP